MINKDIDLTLESWFAGDQDHRLLLNNEDRYVRRTNIRYHHGKVLREQREFNLSDLVSIDGINPNLKRILGTERDDLGDWVETHNDILDRPPASLPSYCWSYVIYDVLFHHCECCGVELNLFTNSTGYLICDKCNETFEKPFEL
jgi:hypothetical protein